MTTTRPGSPSASAATQAVTPAVLAALGTVYVVWGSTCLAIKYTVTSLPPFLAIGIRFLLGALFLGEPLTVYVLVGGSVIIAAVALVITSESRARRRSVPLEPA